MDKEKEIDYKVYKTFEINVPKTWRESTLNTIIQDLSELYEIEKYDGYSDYQIKINTLNEIVENMIIQLETLKLKEI